MSFDFTWTTIPTADHLLLLERTAQLEVLRLELGEVLDEYLTGPTFTLDQIVRAKTALVEALVRSGRVLVNIPVSGLPAPHLRVVR